MAVEQKIVVFAGDCVEIFCPFLMISFIEIGFVFNIMTVGSGGNTNVNQFSKT